MYQLKITIDGITPPIWRLIKVPETFTLNKLHHIIQIAFGWDNIFLYCFMHSDVPTTNPILWGGGTTIWDKKVRIKDVLLQPGDSLPYVYDLPATWCHTIVLEQVTPGLSRWARCLDGARAAPPLECSGIQEYQELIYHLCHPEIDGYLALFDWLGDDYDSELFERELTNQSLRELSSYIRENEGLTGF